MSNDLEALHTEMTALNAKIKALKDEASKTSQEVFKGSLAKFFELVPEIQIIYWRQYTPYFNDGETCEFDVHSPSFYTDEESFENDGDRYENNPFEKPSPYAYEKASDKNSPYYEDYNREIEAYEKLVKECGKERIAFINRAIDDVVKLFSEIDDDYFLMMFGDHSEIKATKDGFQVDEYEHD